MIGLLAGGIFVGKPQLFSSPFPAERQFEFTYRAVLSNLPEGTDPIRIWIPLASSRDGQKLMERNISAPVPYEIHREPQFGNEMLYAEVKGPEEKELEFKIDYGVVVSGLNFSRPSDSEPADKFLKPSRLMKVTDLVKEKTKEATAGMKIWRDKARGIYEYVIGHMVYDKTTPGWGEGDTIRACLLGRGNCTDFHSLFISMAHAAEIPSRFKIGFTIPERESSGTIAGYHCWAEFFDEKRRWLPVDASEAWKNPEKKEHFFGHFDPNKFLMTLGRDIELVPRQGGDPINIFIYPHVEADGKILDEGIQTEFFFRNLKN